MTRHDSGAWPARSMGLAAVCLLALGCVPGGGGGGGGGGSGGDDRGAPDGGGADAEARADEGVDATLPDLGRTDVGEDCVPTDELCNGADDDCDGVIDNGFPGLGQACGGDCAPRGVMVCTADGSGVECDAPAGEPAVEICDGLDDDCDGTIDEGFDLGAACSAGVGECAVEGARVCAADGADTACDAEPGAPSDEVCDGLDNDCDGQTDEVPGAGELCSVGIGGCQTGGVMVCGDDGLECDAEPGLPSDEICDGIDNDCNGTVDDPPVCAMDEVCDNGADDDLDGDLDCADADCAGDPACAPPVRDLVLLCGRSQRDMATLIEPGDGVAFAAGCAPDLRTQAMLVSRNGIDQIDDAGWTAYVRDGGRILTEFSASDEIFNALFDAAVVPGALTGSCADNVNPPYRLNRGDSFWLANALLPLGDAGRTGCGYDLVAYPDIVPLGRHTVLGVHLAYRDLGRGRLYLVEADWQDLDAPDDEDVFTDATRTLMRHMVLGPLVLEDAGSFQVNDGPAWDSPDAVAVSCIEACARLFGGVSADYGCSTFEGIYNGQAFVTGYADDDFCAQPGVPEDFVIPAEGAPYDCGVAGCSYSAYVADHCAAASRNYCWRFRLPGE